MKFVSKYRWQYDTTREALNIVGRLLEKVNVQLTESKNPDQTAQWSRLIWIFAGLKQIKHETVRLWTFIGKRD